MTTMIENIKMDTLFYYSKSANKLAGKGVNEEVLNYKIYDELNKIKDWRKILSNLYIHEFIYIQAYAACIFRISYLTSLCIDSCMDILT